MNDNKKVKVVMNEKKSAVPIPDFAVRQRLRPPIKDAIGQKLLEVKGHKPHFDNMASCMGSLLKVVDSSSMTVNPNKPTSPGKKYSPAKSRSPSYSLPVKPLLTDTKSLPAKSPSSPTNSLHSPTNSLSSPIKLSPAANQASSLEENANSSDTELPGDYQLSSPKISGSPIKDESVEQPAAVPAPITSLVTVENNNSEAPIEELTTWECPVVERPENIIQDNGVTMFIRNLDGSYDMFTGVHIPGMQMEEVSGREITINDGPLIILTRDDEGILTYDPEDSVTIDIQDQSIYVLNTVDGTPYIPGTIATGVASGNANSRQNPAEMSSELGQHPVSVAHEQDVIELDPESFALDNCIQWEWNLTEAVQKNQQFQFQMPLERKLDVGYLPNSILDFISTV